jgi:TonB family protein
MRRWLLLLLLVSLVGCGGDSHGGMFVDDPTDDDLPVDDDPPALDWCPPWALVPGIDDAREAEIEGNAILGAVIDTDGITSVIEVLRTNQPGWGFGDAATEAVEQWRYEPALKDGEPLASCFTVFVDFKLDRFLGGQPAVRMETVP